MFAIVCLAAWDGMLRIGCPANEVGLEAAFQRKHPSDMVEPVCFIQTCWEGGPEYQ